MLGLLFSFSALQAVLTFLLGTLVGYGASVARKKVPVRKYNRQRRGSAVMFAEATNKLESAGKIQMHLSPADNAVQLLESVLPLDLDDIVRATIVYALKVLKSDLTHATIPVGLNATSDKSPTRKFSAASNESGGLVIDWLVSNYTKRASTQETPHARTTLRSAAQKVKMVLMLRGHSHANVQNNFVYTVDSQELESINEALKDADDWEWDVWKLHAVTKGRPLQTLGWNLLHKWEVIDSMKLDENKVRKWLTFVEKEYQDTQYHSSTHATDVLQAVNHFLRKIGASECLTPLRIFAVLITAIIHDVGHDGRNNLFHENAHTDRALSFNDQSIQENFHCSFVFKSMSQDPSINILDTLSREDAKEVRRLVILMTLRTDMKTHFQHYQKFKSMAEFCESRDEWSTNPEACDELCANLLHAADLSNPCRPFDMARQWAARVLEEFFAQGDEEEKNGLPVSPLCSRNKTLMATSQIGFISFVVLPYFKVMEQVLPKMNSIVSLLESNLRRWQAMELEQQGCPPLAEAAAAAAAAAPSIQIRVDADDDKEN